VRTPTLDAALTCRELVERLDDYLSRALAPGVGRSVDTHLAECASCRSYTSTYDRTIRLARAALASGGRPAPSETTEDLVRAVLARRRSAS
jgi:predicted anti-sigma-YlaC factor YlaD